MSKYYVSTPVGDESYDYHLRIFADEATTPKEAAEYFASTFRGDTEPPSIVYVTDCESGKLQRFKIVRPTGFVAIAA